MLKPFSSILFRSPVQSLRHAYSSSRELSLIFQEGLYLSSPEFVQQWHKRDHLNEKERNKLDISLSKYWLRSTSRCTPYGTFAGSALATIGEEQTKIILGPDAMHRRSLRLDMNYMAEIVNALVQLAPVRQQLLFTVNNSLYPANNEYRYAEYSIKNNVRSYQLTAVNTTTYLDKILKQASKGATIKTLTTILIQEEQVTEAEATEYITELWLSQLLVPVLEPTVTGAAPLDHIIAQLARIKGADDIRAHLKEIQYLLSRPEEGIAHYKKIEARLEQLTLGITVPKNTLQADLFLNTTSANMNQELVAEIIHQVQDLKALTRYGNNPQLEDFKAKYYARYEDQPMPLSIVLDADLGIGYAGVNDQSAGASEWVDALAVQGGAETNAIHALDYLQRFSLIKYQDWLANSKAYIEIEEQDIKTFAAQTKHYNFPNSMYLMGSLLKREHKLDKDHFTFDVSNFGGPSAANLLGRFTHGDAQLSELVSAILRKEETEHPEAVYAEIAHLPQARIGNILLRPILREYEIPYVGLSGCPKEKQITIEDLYVSIVNSEIILWSKRLNKRVIPRLTTAHNFGYNSLPVYKFLCDLQGQGIAYPNVWDWGTLGTLSHLPRVVYKNLILRKATWKIEEKDIANLPKDKKGYPEYFATFCEKRNMPLRMMYKEGDNELLIDCSKAKGIELLLHYLKRYKSIMLEEFLFNESNCIVHDTAGNPFTNELIIPLYEEGLEDTRADPPSAALEQQPVQTANVQRSFAPYSEWLYCKVYCGAKSAEKILADAVAKFVESSIGQNLFEKFFFIRYADDGGTHFRIRFYNSDLDKQSALFKSFSMAIQPLAYNGPIHKVTFDTYHRELERYDPELIEEAETLFYHDSLAVLRFISLLDNTYDERYRMLFALRGIDLLLSDFKLTLEHKSKLLRQLQSGFFKEFGAHPALQKQLNDRYRKHQQFFTSHFDVTRDAEHGIEEAAAIFIQRSAMNYSALTTIMNQIPDQKRLFDLLSSYVHMFINRLFLAQQRKYELVAYHFLERHYTSRIAIDKKDNKHAVSIL